MLFPTGHSLAAFPRKSLACYIRQHPTLTFFARLLTLTGVMACLETAGDASASVCAGGVPWVSRTVFAPVDSAFASLSPALLAWLFSPLNRPLARLIALTHILRGDTYVYTCTLAETLAAWGSFQREWGVRAVVVGARGGRQQAALAAWVFARCGASSNSPPPTWVFAMHCLIPLASRARALHCLLTAAFALLQRSPRAARL